MRPDDIGSSSMIILPWSGGECATRSLVMFRSGSGKIGCSVSGHGRDESGIHRRSTRCVTLIGLSVDAAEVGPGTR